MLPGLFFTFWRLSEIVTLIPLVGMLSWFVHGFTENNTLTPNFILVLFIVSVLALVWAVATLVGYASAKHSAIFVAFIDLCFVGAFIAGVYELRGIAKADCANFQRQSISIYNNLGPFGYVGVQTNNGLALNLNKNCGMLKACFAFGIMNTIFFFFTSLISLWVRSKHRDDYYDGRPRRTYYEERRVRRSTSRGHYGSPRRSHHSSRRSSHSRAVI
jgi:sugar phosphate permease